MGLFRHTYHDHPDEEPQAGRAAQYALEHYDLHATGYVSYAARMPFSLDGISFHPTYEGKCLTFMREHAARFSGWWKGNGKTMFWIVGSKPTAGAMIRHLK